MHVHVAPFYWVALIFVIVALRHRRRMTAMRLGLGDGREPRIGRRSRRERAGLPDRIERADAGELAELRERVQVLERIATDGRSARELSDEIEALRSPRANEVQS